MKLNNNGQTLVTFIFIIPIILLLLVLIYDVGVALNEKNRLSNTSYLSIDYALDNIDNIDENTVINYILKNCENLNSIYVVIDDKSIDIELGKKIKGFFGKSFRFDLVEIKSKYRGSISNGRKNIERIK